MYAHQDMTLFSCHWYHTSPRSRTDIFATLHPFYLTRRHFKPSRSNVCCVFAADWCPTIKKLVDLGLLELTERADLAGQTYRHVIAQLIGSKGADLAADVSIRVYFDFVCMCLDQSSRSLLPPTAPISFSEVSIDVHCF